MGCRQSSTIRKRVPTGVVFFNRAGTIATRIRRHPVFGLSGYKYIVALGTERGADQNEPSLPTGVRGAALGPYKGVPVPQGPASGQQGKSGQSAAPAAREETGPPSLQANSQLNQSCAKADGTAHPPWPQGRLSCLFACWCMGSCFFRMLGRSSGNEAADLQDIILFLGSKIGVAFGSRKRGTTKRDVLYIKLCICCANIHCI